jgi:hypothetical protein
VRIRRSQRAALPLVITVSRSRLQRQQAVAASALLVAIKHAAIDANATCMK